MTPNQKSYLALFVCCLLSAGLALGLDRLINPRERIVIRELASTEYAPPFEPSSAPVERVMLPSIAPTEFSQAAASVTPGVVFIRSYPSSSRSSDQTNIDISASSGSGVVISSEGLIATNNHVIEGAERIQVTLSDKREYTARVLGVDESTDLALLRIDASGLHALTFGDSDSLRVGEWVLAVGNPFNLESTVTAGIVSAKGRSIDILEGEDRIESFVQTDAAVNPGNSGGALVNTSGQLVGINTAIITNSGRHEGFAFAIPGNLAQRILRDLRDYGEVRRGMLGVYIEPIDARRASRLGLPEARGVLIKRLRRGGSAESAGLEAGDVLTSIAGKQIDSPAEVQERISRFRPGDRIDISLIRNGKPLRIRLTLLNKNNGTQALVSDRGDDLLHRLGFELRNLTPSEETRLGTTGARVISIFRNSAVEATNMDAGFVITAVNDKQVRNLQDVLSRLREAGRDDKILLRGRYERFEGDYYYSFIMR